MKPTIAVFRPPMNLIPLNNQHVQFYKMDKLLQVNFNEIIIDYSCDYTEILERFHPDVALFHFEEGTIGSIDILNAKNNNSIPKTALATIDSSSVGKGFFYRFMQEYGVEDIFSIEVTTGEVFPEIKNNLFYIPHFIDSDINFDYKLGKNIPVLLTGQFESKFYTWRASVKNPILNNFPSLYFRHPGYYTNAIIPDLLRIYGESYYKILNSSWIVPTCGSFKNTVLMKHFEIPGAKSCLVCDENETVKMHGFADMENCVFSESSQIVEKINYLFSNPGILQKIIDSGYELVHSKHTHKHRPQIFQWYQLTLQKKPGQKIIQPSILGDLELVEINSAKETLHIHIANDVDQITEIDELISKSKYNLAETESKRIIDFAEYIHDAKLRLYLIHMLNGRKEYASYSLKELLNYRIDANIMLDPLVLTIFIIHLLSLGKFEKAVYYSKIALTKRRKELDFARLLAFKIGDQPSLFNSLVSEINKSKAKIDLKSMYYFYSGNFNLLTILEKITRKNIGHNIFTYEMLLNSKGSASNNSIELAALEEVFDSNKLKVDLETLDMSIPVLSKIKRKTQGVFNYMRTGLSK